LSRVSVPVFAADKPYDSFAAKVAELFLAFSGTFLKPELFLELSGSFLAES